MRPLKTHYAEIRDGGWTAVKRKIHTVYKLALVLAPWTFFTVLAVRCLKPWGVVRFGPLNGRHIGHFVADAGQQFAMKSKDHDKKMLDFYWMIQPVCNEFWEKMVRRNFPVCSWVRSLDSLNRMLPGGKAHHRPASATVDSRDIDGLFEHFDSGMPFLPVEDEEAKSWLRAQGWRDGEPFACLLVRDNAYYMNTEHLRPEQSFHDYRDTCISNYVPAAEWLADQGVWVLRMGKIMAEPIPSEHPKIIDYAFHPERSDFLDIWLFARCNLCISTGTGSDAVSSVYRRPLLFLNFIPMTHLVSWCNALHAGKKLLWKKNGVFLKWKEYLENGYNDGISDYENAGIRIVDLTPEEILTIVQEMWLRMHKKWAESEEDRKYQEQFWSILKRHPVFQRLHGWIHPEARVASTWLRLMGERFLE